MGWRFDFAHANLVAYLSEGDEVPAPQTPPGTLANFAQDLTEGRYHGPYCGNDGLSPGMDVVSIDPRWLRSVHQNAEQCLDILLAKYGNKELLDSAETEECLLPLRGNFQGYLLYVLIIPKRRASLPNDFLR